MVEIQNLKDDNKRLMQELNQLKNMDVPTRQELNNIMVEIQNLKTNYNGLFNKLNQELNEVKNNIPNEAELIKELNTLKNHIDNIYNYIEGLQDDINELNNIYLIDKNLKRHIQQLEQRINQYEKVLKPKSKISKRTAVKLKIIDLLSVKDMRAKDIIKKCKTSSTRTIYEVLKELELRGDIKKYEVGRAVYYTMDDKRN